MKRIAIVVGILVVLGIAGYFAFMIFSKKTPQGSINSGVSGSTAESTNQDNSMQGSLPPPQENPPVNNQVSNRAYPDTPTIKIGTSQGIVEVNNFYKSAVDTEEGLIILANPDEYDIAYDPSNSSFIIAIKINSAGVRQNAENELLHILNVSQNNACKLNAIVTFPPPDGEKSRLSFCFGNVK
jgi:hypothetical protein